MKKIIPLIILALFVFGCTQQAIIEEGSQSDAPGVTLDLTEKFIVANPVNLDQMKAVSRFRSCAGHEFSRINLQGEREPVSSMKHYFVPKDSLLEAGGRAEVYAPFDGVISRIDPDDTARGRQFIVETRPFNGWMFTFFHIDRLPKIEEGAEVKAGELLGYAVTPEVGYDFDVALQWFEKPGKENFKSLDDFWGNTDNIFTHMTVEVLSEYEKRGFVVEEMIISKEYREANPCECHLENDGMHDYCEFYTPHDDAENYFPLEGSSEVNIEIEETQDYSSELRNLESEIDVLIEDGNIIGQDHYEGLEDRLNSIDGIDNADFDRVRSKLDLIRPPQAQETAEEVKCTGETPVFTHDITDFSKINQITPPGSVINGEYKGHSFIWTEGEVPVYAPMDLTLRHAVYYIEGGIPQYVLYPEIDCEWSVKFDHILNPVDEIKNILPDVPQQSTGYSGEIGPIQFEAGDLIAYTTGTPQAHNWDFGVYYNNEPKCPYDYYVEEKSAAYHDLFVEGYIDTVCK